MIKGVLFDMDGVLLESEEYITRAGMQMFREKGLEVKFEDFREFTGMGENRFLGGVAQKYGIEFKVDEDKARTYQIYEEMVAGRLKPLEGVNEFIQKCKKLGLKIAVATSADRIKMEINLKEIGIPESEFDATVNALEIRNKKPDPEVFIKAASKLEIPPGNCLVVEDAVSGIKAALSAGCRCLALTTSFSREELSNAHWIANTLNEAPDECLTW